MDERSNETSYEYLSQFWIEKSIADYLRFTLPLLILPTSLINNILSFLALRTRQMRGTSTTFYMLLLSVLDPLVLISKNLVYFPTPIISNAISCKILYFIIYVVGYTTVWILVIMTGDKFFAVWFPLKASYFCTISRAQWVCCLLLLITSAVSMHHFWTINSFYHSSQHYCSYDLQRYPLIERYWRSIDFVIWCFLPFILILTLSVLIIMKLHQRRHQSPHSIKDKTSSDPMIIRSTQNVEVIRSRHRHITLMLLSVAGVFLLLTLPNSIYFVLDLTYGFNRPPTSNDYSQWLRYRRLNILTVIMFQLSDLQHATNFFLYLLTSKKFRQAVRKNFYCVFRRCSSASPRKDPSNRTQYGLSFQTTTTELSNITRTSRSLMRK